MIPAIDMVLSLVCKLVFYQADCESMQFRGISCYCHTAFVLFFNSFITNCIIYFVQFTMLSGLPNMTWNALFRKWSRKQCKVRGMTSSFRWC